MESRVDTESSIIEVMSPELAGKIAAGEVIQRPASVVKELLDNAIDAGADQITIIVQNSGRTLIQVIDNGCGMSKADLRLCFQQHATSKIHTIDDLFRIRTLGFRGEAMASIASVSQTELKSRLHQDESGYQIDIYGGEENRFEPTATDAGTSVAVRNLFYNIPARRQFLKTDATEFRHILRMCQSAALSNTKIAFKLVADGNTVYNLPSQSLEQRAAEMFGKSYRGNLVPFEESTSMVTIHGLLSDPRVTKKSRGEQFIFVNGRPVQHRYLTHLVTSVYRSWIGDDDYPFYVLFLETDPGSVDVNVHPAKLEIKFDDERSVVQLTRSVIKKALHSHLMVPDLNGETRMKRETFDSSFSGFGTSAFDSKTDPGNRERNMQFPSRINFGSKVRDGSDLNRDLYEPAPGSSEQRQRAPEIRDSSFWQLHDRYILTQTRSGFCLIDQHLAHMRIIYEKALSATEESLPSTQQLLFAQNIELNANDYSLLEELLPIIKRMGFSVSLLSGQTAVISGVPADITIGDERQVLREILQQYREFGDSLKIDARRKVAISFASRVAIPAGKKLRPVEMETIIDQLFACEEPYRDPLKRPTMMFMSLDEIQGRFS